MTQKDLLELLAPFPDDARVIAAGCGTIYSDEQVAEMLVEMDALPSG